MKLIKVNLFIVLLMSSYAIDAQVSFNSQELEKHVTLLASDSLEGRGFGTNQMARDYIVNEFKNAGLQPFDGSYVDTFSVRINIIRIEGKNVVGLIPGNDPDLKNEYIVLGAHYDHLGYRKENEEKIVFNGADDNASGTAAVIELAKMLVKDQSQLKRSVILIAFDGEESGLLGSTSFVKNCPIDVSNIKLMFSLDMVGMYNTNNGVDLHGIGSLENFETILEKVKEDVKITNQAKGVENRTDTQPFGDKGIPSIHVFTGSKSPYHKPEDDSNLLDYEGMAKVCGLVYRFTLEASSSQSLEPISSLTAESEKKENEKFAVGMRINVGSSFYDYKDQFFVGKDLVALETGIFAQVRISKHFRLQPEVVYELKGSESVDGDIRMHAVTVPVNLLLTTGDPSGFTPMGYLSAGGYYSHNFAGKAGSVDVDFDNIFEPEEYGFTLGVGIQMRGIQIGYYHKVGLSNVTQQNTVGEIRSNSSYFSFGLLF